MERRKSRGAAHRIQSSRSAALGRLSDGDPELARPGLVCDWGGYDAAGERPVKAAGVRRDDALGHDPRRVDLATAKDRRNGDASVDAVLTRRPDAMDRGQRKTGRAFFVHPRGSCDRTRDQRFDLSTCGEDLGAESRTGSVRLLKPLDPADKICIYVSGRVPDSGHLSTAGAQIHRGDFTLPGHHRGASTFTGLALRRVRTGFERTSSRLKGVFAYEGQIERAGRAFTTRFALGAKLCRKALILAAAILSVNCAPADAEDIFEGSTPGSPLSQAIGKDAAAEIHGALTVCLDEVALIVKDLIEMGDEEEAALYPAEGAADCRAAQERDVRIALLSKQEADQQTRLANLRANTVASQERQADLRKGVAVSRTRMAEASAIVEAWDANNVRLTQALIDEAICSIQGRNCAALRAEMARLFDQGDTLRRRAEELRRGRDLAPNLR